MSTLNLDTIELVSALRKAPLNGSQGSFDYNESAREVLADLAAIAETYNNIVRPLLSALEDAALLPSDSPVGIEGRTILADSSDLTTLFYDTASSTSYSIAETMRLLKGMLDTFKSQLDDMSVQVGSLNARLASTNQNDFSLALQSFAATMAQINGNVQLLSNQVASMFSTLSNTKAVRAQTSNIVAQQTLLNSVTWATAFVDNSYTVEVSLEDTSGMLRIDGFDFLPNGTGIEVRITNTDTTNTYSGYIHAVGRHD